MILQQTLLSQALSYWTITRLRHNWIYIPLALSFYSFASSVNQPTPPRRNSLSLRPHLNFKPKCSSLNYSKTIPKLVFAKFLISSTRIILRQFLKLSLPNFFISYTRIILRQFLNLSLPNLFIYSTIQSQLTCFRFGRRMILLALAQN